VRLSMTHAITPSRAATPPPEEPAHLHFNDCLLYLRQAEQPKS
jgi:hypothetical protein